jgi:hypothetical protein
MNGLGSCILHAAASLRSQMAEAQRLSALISEEQRYVYDYAKETT